MLQIAIVEDDSAYAAQLKQFAERYASENNMEIKCVHFPDGLDIVEGYKPIWDIIMLDIEMPMLDGMSAAEQIRKRDPSVLLMFITNVAQYAIQGYEVNALDYVLKPINYYAFSLKLRKACRILEERSTQAVMLPLEGETIKVPVSSILYIEVADHQLVYHTTMREFKEFGALRKLEDSLGNSFARCNHCYLVNLKYIDGMKDDCVVIGEEELKISRAKKKEFMQKVSDFYRFGGR